MNKQTYSNYLQTRRWTGFIYRFLFIYPFFLKYLGKENIDYGCGVGDFLVFSKLFKKKIIGLDINLFNVEICKNKGCKALLISSKKNILSLKKQFFDCIIIDNVIEHIELPNSVIHELYYGLKAGGYLVIGIPVGAAGYNADPDHKTYYDEILIDSMIQSQGFKFNKKDFFWRPFKNKWLRKYLRQYCYFVIYQKI